MSILLEFRTKTRGEQFQEWNCSKWAVIKWQRVIHYSASSQDFPRASLLWFSNLVPDFQKEWTTYLLNVWFLLQIIKELSILCSLLHLKPQNLWAAHSKVCVFGFRCREPQVNGSAAIGLVETRGLTKCQ